MKLIVFNILLLSIFTSCASLEIRHHSSYNQVHNVMLPRKLRLIEESTIHKRVLHSGDELHPLSRQSSTSSGKHYKEPEMKHGKSVTRQENWLDHADKSHYFTMDYSHVRRRRPIHNRSINLSP